MKKLFCPFFFPITLLLFCLLGCPDPPVIKTPPARSLKLLLNRMLAKLQSKIHRKQLRVSIGNLTYQNSQIPSSFARYLSNKLSAAISRTKFMEEFPREKLDALLAEQDLSQRDIFDPNSAAKIGKLKGVQAILMGSYWDRGKKIEIFLRLLQVATGKNLGTVSESIEKELLPKSLLVEPPHYERTKMVLASFAPSRGRGDFNIQLWVDRGRSATYRVGEVLKVKFRSSRDCYLKLYHISTTGRVKLIFPYRGVNRDNKIQAGIVYTIPDKGDNFRFRMKPPLGTEVIHAMASTEPFKRIESSFKTLGEVGDIQRIRYRGLEVEVSGKSAERAESTCMYTILE